MFKPNREFQAGLDTEETRRRRQNDSLSLRRKTRETSIQKKRQRILARSPQTSNNKNNNNNDSTTQRNNGTTNNNNTRINHHKTLAQLPKFVAGCFSNNTAAQFECTRQFRMLLSSQHNPPIREVIDCGVVPRFIQFCRNNQMPQLQYESLWALLNIASGPAECTAHIIRNGSHNVFIDLLRSPLYEIREQALWALGNIAGDGVELKNLLLNNHILINIFAICSSTFDKQFVTNFNNNAHVNNDPFWQFMSLLSTASWTLSNLCRGGAPPKVEHLEQLIKSLHCLLSQALSVTEDSYRNYDRELTQKNEIIMNVAWGFSYLTQYDQYQAQLVEKMGQAGIIQQFVALMDYKNQTVRHPISRLIGNILTGSDEQTKQCLNLGILSRYSSILMNLANSKEQREICWAISNICAGPMADKLLVLKSNIFPIMIDFLQNKTYECAKEALWAISNATTDHDKRIICPLVDLGVIQALCAFLRKYETRHNKSKNKILLVALECIENILIVGDQHLCPNEANKYAILLEESGAVQYLEELQADDDNIGDGVYEKCVDIITKYFDGQAEEFTPNNTNDETLDYGHFNPYYQSNNTNTGNNNNSNNQQNDNNNNAQNNTNGQNNSNNNGNVQFSFGVNSNSGGFGF